MTVIAFPMEELIDRTKATQGLLQNKCTCCNVFLEKLVRQASKQSIKQSNFHSDGPDPAGEHPCL